MKRMKFAEAIESALAQAMAEDESILVLGEDVEVLRMNLFARFGRNRVRSTPISESAFVGAAVTASMAGLRPVVEIMFVDFIGVTMDAVLNHAAKVHAFSGGKWSAPLVIRSACGGGYGDGGQHEQSLWGWLAHIPGLSVVVPSTPADAGGLMLAALRHDQPVIFLEHKLLADYWLDYLGSGGRKTVSFAVPGDGAEGEVPERWEPISLGVLKCVREGRDLTIASVGVGVHRAVAAAAELETKGVSAEVLDLRSVAPLDVDGLEASVARTRALVVVDEDYKTFGLSGEASAALQERGVAFKFARVCTETTIPYARHLEDETLPNQARIVRASLSLMGA